MLNLPLGTLNRNERRLIVDLSKVLLIKGTSSLHQQTDRIQPPLIKRNGNGQQHSKYRVVQYP